jgi:hypothetical protein
LLQAAGFDLIGQTHSDRLFRGFPLIASNVAFGKPLYFGDVDDPTILVARAMPDEVRAKLSTANREFGIIPFI